MFEQLGPGAEMHAWAGLGVGKGGSGHPFTFDISYYSCRIPSQEKKVSRIEPLSVPAAPTEMHPTIVSGIDTVDVLVSCWPILIFPLSLVTIPVVLKKIP